MPGTVVLSQNGSDRQPALSDGLDAQVRKVEQRCHEPRGGDHVVDLEGEVCTAVGAPEADGQPAVGRSLDAVDGCVQDVHAAAEDVVFVRLQVACPDADERLRVDRQLQLRR
jgi:hypothetical protein